MSPYRFLVPWLPLPESSARRPLTRRLAHSTSHLRCAAVDVLSGSFGRLVTQLPESSAMPSCEKTFRAQHVSMVHSTVASKLSGSERRQNVPRPARGQSLLS